MKSGLNTARGAQAEELVVAQLERRGVSILARRWRSEYGEIDLICETKGGFSFVEVKSAYSHAEAAERVSHGQIQRILRSALAFVAKQRASSEACLRFHVATVNRFGNVRWIADAFNG